MKIPGVKQLVVMGGGESGVGAALLAKNKGLEVLLSEYGLIDEVTQQLLYAHGIPFETGGHTEKSFFEANCIVKSPGIPGDIPLLNACRAAGVPIVSEIEFASWYCRRPIIAITGSNGKTTTTSLVYHILQTSGYQVGVGGNIGTSFARLLLEEEKEVYVLELSSFQLDDIHSFHPHIAVLLNISPDHLDRYEYDLLKYAAAKFKIAQNLGKEDVLVYNQDDPLIAAWVSQQEQSFQRLPFGADLIHQSEIEWGNKAGFDMRDSSLKGRHNQLNSLAAALSVQAFGVSAEAIRKGLRSFSPVPHRLEFVGSIEGVDFINDSKATNVEAVYYALDAMENPTIWIAGGVDKGNDYGSLKELVSTKVKALIILGSGSGKLIEAFPDLPTYPAGNMKEAIQLAVSVAEKNDTVLLSPACASFDLFQNYEDRGDQFRNTVLTRRKLTQ